MSSLGGSTNGGNSVDPGVPGAGNVDRWSKYRAISDVDVGGYKIVNADIDLCNDAIENVNILNSTLAGTTTLASGHSFTGDVNIDSNTLFVDSANNRIGIITSTPSNELDVNGIARIRGQLNADGNVVIGGGTIAGNAIFSANTEVNVGVNSAVHTSTSEINLTTGIPDPAAPGDYNHFNVVNEGTGGRGLVISHAATGSTDVFDAVIIPNTSSDPIELKNDVVLSAGKILATNVAYPSTPYGYIQSRVKGAPDLYMGEDNANPTNDQFGYNLNANIGGGADLGLMVNAKNGGAGTDTFENIATFYSSVNTTGTFPGKGLQVIGNITGAAFVAASLVEAPNVSCTNLAGDGSNPLNIDGNGQNITIDTTGTDVNIPKATFAYGSHGSSKIESTARNVAYIGQNPRTTGDINCLRFVAPNGTSYCYAFCGQKDALTPNSVGLASVNQSTNDVVGFAPSAISGIEKWSFTARHQSQYKGKIGKEHYGMVMAATGDVVGIYDKGDLIHGINHKDPNYSNATPVVELCNKRASKAVVGVLREITDEPDTITGDLVYYVKGDGAEKGDKRAHINAIGEGLIWVANTNGNLEVGDLLQSSSIPGYAEKQDDDIVRSCTIGKITMACDFKQVKVPGKKIMTNYKKENLLDTEGRLKWTNTIVKEDKYKMRTLTGGKKACLLGCIYYCG